VAGAEQIAAAASLEAVAAVSDATHHGTNNMGSTRMMNRLQTQITLLTRTNASLTAEVASAAVNVARLTEELTAKTEARLRLRSNLSSS
jgi:predicted  nucleic acid-binding Zn-ribbon protein